MTHPHRLSHSLAFNCFLALILLNPFFIGVTVAQTAQPSKTPKPGKPVVRELKGGDKHRYPLQLKANDYLKLVVEQRGIDVAVRLVGPDGKLLQEVDGPNGTQGAEPLSCVTDIAGSYTLEIEALKKTASPGRYELTLQAVRPATSQERAGREIEKLISEADTLRRAGKLDQSLPLAQQAVEKSETALDSEHSLLVGSLFVLARIYSGQAKFKQAEPLYLRALAILEKTLGADQLQVATILNHLGSLYQKTGNYPRAEPLFQRELAIWEKSLGPDHPNVAISLNNLGSLYQRTGDYARAEPLLQRALAIRKKSLGPEHLSVAETLNNLAVLYSNKGDYSQAETLYQQSLAIQEKVLGPDHPNVANSLNNLALLYWDKGDYRQAESLYQRTLAIQEKTLGSNDPNVAFSFNNLATLYQNKGDYRQAESLYQRALAIWEKALGPDHPKVGLCLNNLGLLYNTKGDYQRAEPLFQRALAIQEKALGPNHPEVATSLNNLAALYWDKGDRQRAEPLFQQALDIQEKVLGPDHRETARSLNNLGVLYSNKDDYQRAEPLLQRALVIQEKVLGADHPEVAQSFNNLAGVYRGKGDTQKAEFFFKQALAILEKAFGPDHPQPASVLNSLAVLSQIGGDYARAEPLFQRALAIREKTLGLDHPDVAQTLNNLSKLYRDKGDMAQGIQFQIRGNDAVERDLIRNLLSGSENQKILYLKKTSAFTDQTLSLHLQSAPQSVEARQAAFTVLLRRKGRGLDAMASAIETLRQQQTPEVQKLLDDLANLVDQISVLTLKGPGKQKPDEHLAYLKELEAQKEKLEAQISAKSAEYQVQGTPITLENIQPQIPADGMLVEFAFYLPFNPTTRKLGASRCAVYTLDHLGDIKWADLGEATPIEQAVSAFCRVVSKPKADLAQDITPAAQALDKLIMKPVRALVGKSRHLLISPDGMLNLIPFAALMDEKRKFLVETYTLTYLTSGRDLLRLQNGIKNEHPPLIMGNPDYADGNGPQIFGHQFPRLDRLIGTAAEAQQLKSIFPDASVFLGDQATKAVLTQVHRPEFVHIGTHGFFFAGDQPDRVADAPSRHLLRSDDASADLEKIQAENPLLRSYLFFAGANHTGSKNQDGILTALETTTLDLWGTKLVTLSACDTGLGDVKNGDGVYGLRRALVLAGSESQMISLWSVSDQATRELMVDYYTRLKAGEGRSEALRNVQLKMLKTPRRQHPFYWASFIQSGEWATLAGKR
ncbi:MAG: CHAT domain-containing protein [Acidobacteria bacterium]|nr:CHAT domain-containing protein [Acidobacteriota bacterium]